MITEVRYEKTCSHSSANGFVDPLIYAVGNLVFVLTGNQAVAVFTAPVIVLGALGYAFLEGMV